MSTDVDEEQLWSWVDRDAPELERFLERHPERRGEVDAIRDTMRGLSELSADVDLPVPERIGPYRVLRRIGSGGMGLVYEAEQPSPRRRVALKVIRGSSLADERMVRLFQREAQALARLHHAGIAAIYEAGRTDDGLHWFAMELVDGRTIAEHAREERLGTREKVELFRRVCDAVDHAHRSGVVHRDLKPANVLVGRDGAPKVLDFGLARLSESDLAVSLATTDAGRVLGTLPYMSPEQARGDSREVDARSDVYALGVMLYELLTGRLPLDVTSSTLVEAVRIIGERAPRRPGAIASLPRELDAVLLTALAKEPGRRYADVGAFAADLTRFLAGLPVVAQRPTLRYRLRKLVSRHKLATALAALVVLVGLWGTWQWMRSVDYDNPLLGGIYPEVSPYSDIRWRGSVPQVLVDGQWFELLQIDRLDVATIVQFCRQTTPDLPGLWRKRFEEDLWQVLWRMGRVPGLWVDLRLRELGSGREIVDTRLWTPGRRTSLYRTVRARRARFPFEEVRFGDDGGLSARVGGEWVEVLSIDGVPTERIALQAREAGSDWQMELVEALPLLLADLTDEPVDTVRVVGRGADGSERDLGELELSAANASAVRRDLLRSPFDDLERSGPPFRARIGGDWYEVLAVEGLDFATVMEAADRIAPGAFRARDAFVRAMRALGVEPGDAVGVRVRDPRTGAERLLEGVPLRTTVRSIVLR